MGLKVEEVTDKIYKDKYGANGGGGNGKDIHRTSVVLKVEEVTDKIYTGTSVGLKVEEVTDKIYTGQVWG